MNNVIQIIQKKKMFNYNILKYIFYYYTILYSLLEIIFNYIYDEAVANIQRLLYTHALIAVNYLTYLNF